MVESQHLFSVHALHKSYGSRQVLTDLEFDVRRGECFVVLGRSGSGKSVALRQLNGLERPDSGTVAFDGLEISSLPEKDLMPVRKRIAMLFQGGALFDSMTVFENVAFPLREHRTLGEAEIRDQVSRHLGLVGLFDVEDKMPSALSGGMKKRVALARSIALDPEAVLFDEPTTGLDPRTSATIAHLIQETQRQLGVTSVVVTHDLALARRVGDRVAYLDDGRFRFIGTWDEADNSEDPEFEKFLAGEEEDDHVK
jgi:phospholipid/cholesterol/gamma-HCH transport system ATP-binding protein